MDFAGARAALTATFGRVQKYVNDGRCSGLIWAFRPSTLHSHNGGPKDVRHCVDNARTPPIVMFGRGWCILQCMVCAARCTV